MTEKKRGAIIGIGGIGMWHGEMMQATGRIQLVAVCDLNEALREKAAGKFPDAAFYTSYREMLSREKPDITAVVTPHNLHAPIAIHALQAGSNVIVEKPMATRYEDAVAMIRAARRARRSLTVFHNRRLDGWYLAAMSVIRSGILGDLVEMHSAINYKPSPTTWRGWKEASGGILFDWGAHLVDYLLHFARSPVRSVSGFFYRARRSNPAHVEDHGSLQMKFVSGATGTVTISGADRSTPLRYRIVGTRGTLTDEWNWSDDSKLKVFTTMPGGEQATMEVKYARTQPQKYYDNIADHLCEGKPLLVSPESAAMVINVLCAAERSHLKGGAPVPLSRAP